MSLVSFSSSSSDDDNDTSSEGSGATGDTRSSVLSFSLEGDPTTSSTKYNIENCNDFHVGPKLFAENCQINWNGESNFIAKKLMLENVETDSVSKSGNASAITNKWRLRKAHLYVMGLTIWLAIVTCVVIIVLKEETILKGWQVLEPYSLTTRDSESVTTARESTTPMITSTTRRTPPQIVTTPSTTATTKQPSTTTTMRTTLKPFPTLVSRNSWHGLEPPERAARNRTAVRSIIVDNLSSDRCSDQVNCSRILRSLENETRTSLNYNFLIDNSGTIYEARGWNYAADEQTPYSVDLIKFGFIGNYENSHLTEEQKNALSGFIAEHWMDFKTPPLVKAQCCRDIDTEKGPDVFVTCDLYESELFQVDTECIAEVKNCDTRSWIWRYFSNNKLVCDQTSLIGYLTALV
uniref:Peptidoglycan-recognition protein 3 n=1 Tax=Lygus hesperus TaxID=30085 RepID=A0A0A9WZG0_LYGHE